MTTFTAAQTATAQSLQTNARGEVILPRGAENKPVADKYKRRAVRLVTSEKPGTILVDTHNRYLYFVEGGNKATRYGIGVGREGFGWSGVTRVGRKAEWPAWIPPQEMIARERKRGHILPARMEGGPDNPLGSRALYLYRPNGGDTGFRIHGTNQPWSIGQNLSSGCIRMMNKDVEHLYKRVPEGSKVVVIGPGNRQGQVSFEDRGTDLLRTLFGG
ncbi:L,D-transpeptidase [Rhizobiaceae bacterium BDR2-2]|uniref:L,D-transpeptidase n=2 Tax=Ectorhizobium quercum TaxID=2965071 RepID=A0AAE3SU47_9HYPH|nr:L,D-transpeptidase [Ectorhizobium quercum]MCX8996278.1 L,D-transpeptidase [Ectorhizobium quercum]MCX8998683.1 L,D-transpeptidase [Ectorhizobium quercum]